MYYVVYGQPSYLAHHGILGQKWGVRRFQAYGSGYDRKGGKTGKVVGEAKAQRAAAKAAKREAKLARFKEKQGAIIDKDISRAQAQSDKRTAKFESKVQKINEKVSTGKMSGARGEKKLASLQYDYLMRETKANVQKGMLAVEKSKVKNYSYDDMKKENREVVATHMVVAGMNAVSVGLVATGALPIAVVATASTRQTRRGARLRDVANDEAFTDKMTKDAFTKASASSDAVIRRSGTVFQRR